MILDLPKAGAGSDLCGYNNFKRYEQEIIFIYTDFVKQETE